ncbi:MAG: hypothetical protein Q9157_008943 [Trypethelium eluteriae]
MTDAHIGFGSALTNWGDNLTGFQAWDSSDEAQFWQIMTFQGDLSSYAFRNKAAGPLFALGITSVPQEVDTSCIQPRLQPMDPVNDGQKWKVGDSGNSTYYIFNSANGILYHLDIHPGNPVNLSSQTSAEPYDPRQQWEFQSLMPIGDSQWSQMAAATPTATDAGPISSTSNVEPTARASGTNATGNISHRSGLPASAAAGIGIGGALAIVTLISVLFDLRLRRTKRECKQQGQTAGDQPPILPQTRPTQAKEVSAESEKVELPIEEQGRVELPNREREEVELPNSENRLVPELLA